MHFKSFAKDCMGPILIIALLPATANAQDSPDSCRDSLRDGVKSNLDLTRSSQLNWIALSSLESSSTATKEKNIRADGIVPISESLVGKVGLSIDQKRFAKQQMQYLNVESLQESQFIDVSLSSGDPYILKSWLSCMQSKNLPMYAWATHEGNNRFRISVRAPDRIFLNRDVNLPEGVTFSSKGDEDCLTRSEFRNRFLKAVSDYLPGGFGARRIDYRGCDSLVEVSDTSKFHSINISFRPESGSSNRNYVITIPPIVILKYEETTHPELVGEVVVSGKQENVWTEQSSAIRLKLDSKLKQQGFAFVPNSHSVSVRSFSQFRNPWYKCGPENKSEEQYQDEIRDSIITFPDEIRLNLLAGNYHPVSSGCRATVFSRVGRVVLMR